MLDYDNYSLVEEAKKKLPPHEKCTKELVGRYWRFIHDNLFADKTITWNKIVMVGIL